MSAVVLIGATGFLGTFVQAALGHVTAIRAQDVLDSGAGVVRAALASDGVVVNAAGARTGDVETLHRLNVELPRILAEAVDHVEGHLVHLGSAAEYGTDQEGGWCDESAEPRPGSDYGRTKLAGTQHVLAGGRATVLRVFNVAVRPPQPGTPLADVVERVAAGRDSGVVHLLAGGSARDWVRPEFVAAGVAAYAARHRPVGVYNVSSGLAVRMQDLVLEALRLLGSDASVHDDEVFPANTVAGRAERWRAASGLAEQVSATDLGALVAQAVDELTPSTERGER